MELAFNEEEYNFDKKLFDYYLAIIDKYSVEQINKLLEYINKSVFSESVKLEVKILIFYVYSKNRDGGIRLREIESEKLVHDFYGTRWSTWIKQQQVRINRIRDEFSKNNKRIETLKNLYKNINTASNSGYRPERPLKKIFDKIMSDAEYEKTKNNDKIEESFNKIKETFLKLREKIENMKNNDRKMGQKYYNLLKPHLDYGLEILNNFNKFKRTPSKYEIQEFLKVNENIDKIMNEFKTEKKQELELMDIKRIEKIEETKQNLDSEVKENLDEEVIPEKEKNTNNVSDDEVINELEDYLNKLNTSSDKKGGKSKKKKNKKSNKTKRSKTLKKK